MSFVVSPRHGPKHFDESTHGPDMAELAAREAEIAQRVKRELAKIRNLAERQGHAEGFAAGKAEADTAMQSASAALRETVSQLTDPLGLKAADLAGLVTKLAHQLATHIVNCEITISLGPITQLAHRLLEEAAAERMPASQIHLRLNPADHAALSSLKLPDATFLTADTAIAQGGALVEITDLGATHPSSVWDATIQTRLASLL